MTHDETQEMIHTQELYARARAKVRETPELASHEDFILADWREGDEHLRYVIEAPIAEIVDWIAAGEDDEEEGA